MNAKPYLVEISEQLARVRLEAVLIGNAAAALQGAPVTTVDFDFMFPRTPRNMQKIRAVADGLGATILRPYYPAADLYRVLRDDGLQIDFMAAVHGVRSFEALRSRAEAIDLGGASILVASLPDIIRSKRAAHRPRDVAVLDVLEKALEEKKRQAGNARRRAARE
jgi:predicted nucleotidyltransferase